jgi:hypothetical protein
MNYRPPGWRSLHLGSCCRARATKALVAMFAGTATPPAEALFQLQESTNFESECCLSPRKLRKRPSRSIIVQMIIDYQCGAIDA